MHDGPLAGIGVLITRPEHQAQPLADAILKAGGRPYLLPAFDIVARSADDIHRDLAALETADTVIYVSANAARLGQDAVGQSSRRPVVAAIGPATAEMLDSAGLTVTIRPAGGFNSESLLADPAFEAVANQTITIVRGDPGRELLAETLRERGARVQYLSVYSIQPHSFSARELADATRGLMSGDITATIIMSIRTLDCLETSLPPACLRAMAATTLVAPGGRVIQTLAERLPDAHCIEAHGPDARALVEALTASLQDGP